MDEVQSEVSSGEKKKIGLQYFTALGLTKYMPPVTTGLIRVKVKIQPRT